MKRIIYMGDLPCVAKTLASIPEQKLAAWFIEPGDAPDKSIEFCKNERIPLYQVSSPSQIQQCMKQVGRVDLGVIANFGIILSRGNLAMAKKGFVNAHLGLLPDEPGRHPIQSAIQKGKRITGVTLHWATEKVDSGPLIDQRVIAIGPRRDGNEVFERLCEWIPVLLAKNLPGLLTEEAPLLTPTYA